MNYKRVAVLRGGRGEEYPVSMETGKAVIEALQKLGYPYKDVIITKRGEWLEDGLVKKPENALQAVDVVFNALHSESNGNSELLKLLHRLKVPFTGSNALTSALVSNKNQAKEHLKNAGILLPKYKVVKRSDLVNIDSIVEELNEALGSELFLKPVSSGSSVGATHAATPEVVKASIKALLDAYDEVMVEEFIRGKEATVGVLEGFRDTALYSLPAIEIVPPHGKPHFSFDDKFNKQAEEICPGRFSYHEKSTLEEAARIVHKHLHCTHYSRSDFIVRDGEVYFLEVNTAPDLRDSSLFAHSAKAVGLSYSDLVDYLIKTAKW